MTFKQPQTSAEWQTAYSRDEAYRDSDKRSSSVGLVTYLPFIGTLIYFILLLLDLLSQNADQKTIAIRLGIALILIVGAAFFLQKKALLFACDFFKKFYQPPDYVKPEKVLMYRLNGKSRLPGPLAILSQFKYILAKDGEIEKKDDWPAWMAQNIGGPILLIVFDGWALYLERGNRFSRVVGPGTNTPFLEWYERIKYMVDLRPKVKEDKFTVWTKDGIQITLTARLESRIGDPDKLDPSNELIYPYDAEAIKKAVERIALRWPVGQEEPTEFNWVDAAWGQLTGIVPDHISGRTLDDLLLAERESGQIVAPETLKEITEKLNEAAQKFGVYVLNFQIVKVEIPDDIRKLQEEYWKAQGERIATLRAGESKAEEIRLQEKARAKAQRDMILAIAEGLEKNKSKQYNEPILLSLSSVLSESLNDPLMRAYLAKETLETLEKIQTMLDKTAF